MSVQTPDAFAIRADIAKTMTPKMTAYIPHIPTPKQTLFLLLNNINEMLYGGAAGGGKSDVLLMAALQYVDIPTYSAILFRRTYTDLALPGALMDRAQQWLGNTDAKWADRDKVWTFPSGATLAFGYLATEKDKYNYQGAEFQFVGFDELTQFTEGQYLYLFSRLRRTKGIDIPIRMRAASNPGGAGHEWVRQRFLRPPSAAQGKRMFLPAGLNDNPHLDQESYKMALSELDAVTKAQLLEGNWDITEEGQKFKPEWFEDRIDAKEVDVERVIKRVRAWDLAATEPPLGKDADWTAGVLIWQLDDFSFIVRDVKTARYTPKRVEDYVKRIAAIDGIGTEIIIEQEPGASGKHVVEHFRTEVLAGYNCKGQRITGSKDVRATPASSYSEAGKVKLVKARWTDSFVRELAKFPYGAHDDQVDAFSTAMVQFISPARVERFDNPFYE